MKSKILLVLLFFAFSLVVKSQAFPYKCIVADTSGTPLNVRNSGGRVISKLNNGTVVQVTDMSEGEDLGGDTPTSSKVGVLRRGKWVVLGWVATKHLNCNNDFAKNKGQSLTSKMLTGIVVEEILENHWSGIVVKSNNKSYMIQTDYMPSAGDEQMGVKPFTIKTVGKIDKGKRVTVSYTEIDCKNGYSKDVPCIIKATKIVGIK